MVAGGTEVSSPFNDGISDMMLAEVQAAIAKLEVEKDASDDKFCSTKLLMANAEDSELRPLIGLDDDVIFGASMEDPFKAMKIEWHTHGTEET